MITLLKLLIIVISLIVVAVLIRRAIGKARQLDDGIDQYWRDKEANGPGNPYADLAQLLEERSQDKKANGQ
jgi:hypothetical protein